ncbi:hypothetical protein B0H14DRAFT_3465926 [Mycena olivaceomarginata]|nr:hypothetical protein B0H14DRAFT_3465926 [Mycena olivaceomarginata]
MLANISFVNSLTLAPGGLLLSSISKLLVMRSVNLLPAPPMPIAATLNLSSVISEPQYYVFHIAALRPGKIARCPPPATPTLRMMLCVWRTHLQVAPAPAVCYVPATSRSSCLRTETTSCLKKVA